MFITNQGDAPVQIRQSLDAGDNATAERLAHSAKGVSGNIGATGLQALAAVVEKAIKEGQPREQIEKVLVPFAEAHGIMMAHLKEALPAQETGEAEGAGAKAAPMDRQKATQACKKLAELLANDDSEAVDLLNDESDHLRNILGADPFRSIEKAIKDYDFETALELLRGQAQNNHIQL